MSHRVNGFTSRKRDIGNERKAKLSPGTVPVETAVGWLAGVSGCSPTYLESWLEANAFSRNLSPDF